jgi:hypothetical protein
MRLMRLKMLWKMPILNGAVVGVVLGLHGLRLLSLMHRGIWRLLVA